MKNLIIIGARGWGREVLDMARSLPQFKDGSYNIKGFLDDKIDAFEGLRGNFPPVLGAVETYEPQDGDVFLCALGDCHYRRKYSQIILEKGGEFITLIHPGSLVSPFAKIGKGVIICNWCTISNNVDIGDFTMIHAFSTLGHDAKIGAYNSIEAYCFFGGYSQTGDNTTMHVRSAIIPHKSVGANCSVGFGSVVMRNFGDDVHVFGNPARKIEF